MSDSPLILIINLDSRKDRLKKMKERLKTHDFIRIAATSVSEQDCSDISSKGKLSLPEIACTSSHINALKTFLETEHKTCIILEDDVVLGDYFSNFASKFKFLPKGVFVIKLETHLNKFYHSRFPITLEGFKFNRMHTFHHGAAAFATSRASASLIINELEKYDIPVDDVIFDRMVAAKEFGSALQLNPACCIQEKHIHENLKMDSDIEAGRQHYVQKLNQAALDEYPENTFKLKILIRFLKKIIREIIREILKVKNLITFKVRKKIMYRD